MCPEEPRLYTDRCADERCEPFFGREILLERAFLAMRAGRNARQLVENKTAGAFGVFPVVLFGQFQYHSGCGAAGQHQIELSVEPGTLFPEGKSRVDWALDAAEGRVSGHFTVSVADGPPALGEAACELTAPDGTTTDLPTPLSSLALAPLKGARLAASAHALVVEGERARTDVLRLSERLLQRVVGRLANRFTSQVDVDDAHQLAAIELLRLAESFASSKRPRVSWPRYVVLNTNRAVARALEQDGHFGRPERALDRLLEKRPDLIGAQPEVLRVELEKTTGEVAHWSDRRIAQAAVGPARPVSLDELGYDSSPLVHSRDARVICR